MPQPSPRHPAPDGAPPSEGGVPDEVSHRLEAVLERAPPSMPGFLHAVRDVVIVGSSSRGGSSVFTEILRHSAHLVHFRAEINPFLALGGFTHPRSGRGCDALGSEDFPRDTPGSRRALRRVERAMVLDCGRADTRLQDEPQRRRFAHALWFRLSIQWPHLSFHEDQVRSWMDRTLADLRREEGWPPDRFVDPVAFQVRFLREVRTRHPEVNPYYYDLPPSRIRAFHPGVRPDPGPPGPWVLEEPPFVSAMPYAPVNTSMLASAPLLVKTPSNAYRLPFLRRLFPHARIRVLHLTRNAAAAINGLVDGWCFRGFFAHRLPVPLAIRGYSDRFPTWGREWWKFDLPPGWQRWRDRSLVEVCGFQWRSSHEALLRDCEANHTPVFQVRFEDVVAPRVSRRRQAFSALREWLGIPPDPVRDPHLDQVVRRGLPPIMATQRPRHRRWYEKAALLEPVLEDPRTRTLMERLGYEQDPHTWT